MYASAGVQSGINACASLRWRSLTNTSKASLLKTFFRFSVSLPRGSNSYENTCNVGQAPQLRTTPVAQPTEPKADERSDVARVRRCETLVLVIAEPVL
jgi:hypothetical protein